MVGNVRIERMEAGSAHKGPLPKGCEFCARGSKIVLLVTGKCTTGCFYCPLSARKKGREVMFANERLVKEERDIIEEALAIGAEGTGITGGDPLMELDKTLRCIRLLKERFGPKHHIHVYTSAIDRDAVERLERAGLDEIRFHPPLRVWASLETTDLSKIVAETDMEVGLEVPALPGEEGRLRALITYAEKLGMDFVNINELEFSETNWSQLRERGYDVKDDVSSAVMGSEEMAMRMLEMDVEVPLHYCSSSFKDRVQLRNRILRRGERVSLPLDLVTEEGILYRGVIEGDDLGEIMEKLREMRVPEELMRVDAEKHRLEVASWVLEDIAKELDHPAFLVEEYPTADRLEVEREPINRAARRLRPH